MKYHVARLGFVLSLFSGLLFLLFATNPQNVPLPVLFLPFILLFMILYMVTDLLSQYLFKNIAIEYRRYIVGFIALLPVGFLLTMSAGQTDINDIALFVLFVILVVFYFSRTSFLK